MWKRDCVYNNLIAKEKIFKKPAFKALEFQSRVNGLGSLSYELQTLLMGKLENYYFALSLPEVEPDSEQYIVEFIPIIETEGYQELVNDLIVNHGFPENHYLSVFVPFSKEELNNPSAIENVILGLDNTLKQLNAKPKPIED